eukprot:1742054-Ditylum_brightwellii.AAC.1
MDAIVALRKEDRDLLEKRANNRRLKNKLQRMREEIKDELVERGRDPTRIRRKYDDMDTLKLTGHCYIQVLLKMRNDATKEDKDFVMAYNSKIRRCDDLSKLEPTSMFKDLLKEKDDAKTVQRKISFNLNGNDKEKKERSKEPDTCMEPTIHQRRKELIKEKRVRTKGEGWESEESGEMENIAVIDSGGGRNNTIT